MLYELLEPVQNYIVVTRGQAKEMMSISLCLF